MATLSPQNIIKIGLGLKFKFHFMVDRISKYITSRKLEFPLS
jgi:hypothetical protein